MSAFPLEADTTSCPGDVGLVPAKSRPSATRAWASRRIEGFPSTARRCRGCARRRVNSARGIAATVIGWRALAALGLGFGSSQADRTTRVGDCGGPLSLEIRRIGPDGGLRLRALRPHALADAPTAFESTLAHEEAFPEDV
jgi:hypothetical protein